MKFNELAAYPGVERVGIVLRCEGMGDCLYAMKVIKRMRFRLWAGKHLDLFTHCPKLFAGFPHVDQVFAIKLDDPDFLESMKVYEAHSPLVALFNTEELPHSRMDTFNFISLPLGIGELTFAEKQIEYFPVEEDVAEGFDVVLNTSVTWPTRTWPLAFWQNLADELVNKGLRVAVVGKDIESKADGILKMSTPLFGCADLVNKLSLDQTYFTIKKSRLFVSCQNGLSVLASATDAELVVLDYSIEWSRHAVFRNSNPYYKVSYVKGACDYYCGSADTCPVPEHNGELKCIPSYEAVAQVVRERVRLIFG